MASETPSDLDTDRYDSNSESGSIDPAYVKSEYESEGDGGASDGEAETALEDVDQAREYRTPAATRSEGSDYEPVEKSESESSPASPAASYNYLLPDAAASSRTSSPLKRPGGAASPRPPKRHRSDGYNRDYLDLLNEDIQDAASGYVAQRGHDVLTSKVPLPASQIGMTFWTPAEKEIFFSALGRLGRDDTPGIAARIGTKCELEVRQYLQLLHDATSARRRHRELDRLELADFPAAVELSQECCEALEEAADAVAVRQERHEERVERGRWGRDIWLVEQGNFQRLEEEAKAVAAEEPHAEPASFFRTEMWLAMPERVFMNSPAEERDWSCIANEHTPAIRATALDDFYSLTVSVTKRLVATALYLAMSRARSRSKRAAQPERTGLVTAADVETAAASLGMKSEKRSFWVECPRRLGLEVYEDPPSKTGLHGTELLSYEDVEYSLTGALGMERLRRHRRRSLSVSAISDMGSEMTSHSSVADDEDSEAVDDELFAGEDSGSEASEEGSEGGRGGTGSVDADVLEEAKEVLLHSAVDVPQTTRARRALIRQIKVERGQEAYAELVDAQATYDEETRMWSLLGRQPATPLAKPEDPEPAGPYRSKRALDDLYSVGRDWREKTKYVSEWEVLP